MILSATPPKTEQAVSSPQHSHGIPIRPHALTRRLSCPPVFGGSGSSCAGFGDSPTASSAQFSSTAGFDSLGNTTAGTASDSTSLLQCMPTMPVLPANTLSAGTSKLLQVQWKSVSRSSTPGPHSPPTSNGNELRCDDTVHVLSMECCQKLEQLPPSLQPYANAQASATLSGSIRASTPASSGTATPMLTIETVAAKVLPPDPGGRTQNAQALIPQTLANQTPSRVPSPPPIVATSVAAAVNLSYLPVARSTTTTLTPASSARSRALPVDFIQVNTWQGRIEEGTEAASSPSASLIQRAPAGKPEIVPTFDQEQKGTDTRNVDPAVSDVRSAFQSVCSAPSASGTPGVTTCVLCQALLQLYAGRQNVQALVATSSLPKPCQSLVDKLMAMQMTEQEHAAVTATFCRFHALHKNRYEVWARTHTKVRCYGAGAGGLVPQALARVATRGDDLAHIESKINQAGPPYIQVIKQYVMKLHNEVRVKIADAWQAKARSWVNSVKKKDKEEDKQINKKIEERKAQMQDCLGRLREGAREEYRKTQQRQIRQEISASADECRNLQLWKRGGYTQTLKEIAAMEKAKRSMRERQENVHVSSKVERERLLKERELDIWLAKMEELRHLQQDQTEKDRDMMYARVEKKLQRVDEEHVIELRHIACRFTQHVSRALHLLERMQRRSVRMRSRPDSGSGDAKLPELEPFVYYVIQSELLAAGKCPDSAASAHFGSPRRETESTGGATGVMLNSAENAPAACSIELSAFADFLGTRFPNLRAAFATIDLNGNGRVTSFELQSWMLSHRCPKDARVIFKELDNQGQGHIGIEKFATMASSFLAGSLRCGRPFGSVGATVLSMLFRLCVSRGAHGSKADIAIQVFRDALRYSRHILGFLSGEFVSEVIPATGETPELLRSTRVPSVSLPVSPEQRTFPSRSTSMDTGLGKSREDDSNTEIGRWAKQMVESWATRRGYMRSRSPQKQLHCTEFRRSSSLGRKRRENSGALEANASWFRSLRHQSSADSWGLRSQDGSRRGAPPPKCKPSMHDTNSGTTRSSSGSKQRSVSQERHVSPSQSPSVSVHRAASPAERAQAATVSPQTPLPTFSMKMQVVPAIQSMKDVRQIGDNSSLQKNTCGSMAMTVEATTAGHVSAPVSPSHDVTTVVARPALPGASTVMVRVSSPAANVTSPSPQPKRQASSPS